MDWSAAPSPAVPQRDPYPTGQDAWSTPSYQAQDGSPIEPTPPCPSGTDNQPWPAATNSISPARTRLQSGCGVHSRETSQNMISRQTLPKGYHSESVHPRPLTVCLEGVIAIQADIVYPHRELNLLPVVGDACAHPSRNVHCPGRQFEVKSAKYYPE